MLARLHGHMLAWSCADNRTFEPKGWSRRSNTCATDASIKACVIAAQALAILVAGSVLGPVAAADRDQPPAANASAAKTGKERLTDKASDEQRVDDCKVAQARRTRPRPTNCSVGAGG
jgi:hypothetical protein